MKRRSFLFLLLGLLAILTSMSECAKENWERINMNLNGVPYSYSTMNLHVTNGKSFPALKRTDTGFNFEIPGRLISSDETSVWFYLSMDCDEPSSYIGDTRLTDKERMKV